MASSIKCKQCGLTNFADEPACRRCGTSFTAALRGSETGTAKRSFSRLPMILLIVVAAVAGYFVLIQTSEPTSLANANTANSNVADQQSQRALQSELDRQRSQRIANAVNISPALSEHQKRTEDTERMMKQLTNSSTP